MKKKVSLLVAVVIAGFVSVSYAQENKVVTAKMRLDEYNKDRDTNDLLAAKEAIDLAANNDKTKDEPKMWLYRGQIYYTLFDHQLNAGLAKIMAKEGKPADKQAYFKMYGRSYATLDTTAIAIAAYAFARVIQLEPKGSYADDSKSMLPACANHIGNLATSKYGSENYPVALAMFERAMAVAQALGVNDTTDAVRQNVQNAGITAEKIKNYPKAVFYYQKLIDISKKLPPSEANSEPYVALIDLYANMKDTAKAFDELKQGRAAYPGDVTLLIKETNFYLHSHNSAKAIENLQTAISKIEAANKPEDKGLLTSLYFALGNTYDNMANPKNDSGRSLDKPSNYEELWGKAEDNYSKATQNSASDINNGESSLFDLVYDLGALYNNRGGYINTQANALPIEQTDKFNKLQAQANDYFKKAQPWLEKALVIARKGLAAAKSPKDQKDWNDNLDGTTSALKSIYVATGQTDKLKSLKEGN